MKKLFVFIMSALMLVGCSPISNKKTSEQMIKECSSGVVLIYNKFYYQVSLPTGQTLYMAGINENGSPINLTMNIEEIKRHQNGMFGTGFFIDKKGHILTNRHVVKGITDEGAIKDLFIYYMRKERQAYLDSMKMAEDAAARLNSRISECYSYDIWGARYVSNQELLQQIKENIEILQYSYNQWKQLSDFFAVNTSVSNVNIKMIPEIGIAYEGTHVNDENDFFGNNSCVSRKVSDKENSDLAVIQLKSESTPEFAHIFDVSGRVIKEKASKSIGNYLNQIFWGEIPLEEVEADELKIGQTLYVIGYNQGLDLAQTQIGIEPQITEGKIAQLPDGERIMYNISVIHGSSGSPVIDDYGCLRGVNFAKTSEDADLGFAVPMTLVKSFLKE